MAGTAAGAGERVVSRKGYRRHEGPRGHKGPRGNGWGGLSMAVVSAATFGTSGTFGTSLLAAGWTPGTAVLARVTLAALMLTIPAVVALAPGAGDSGARRSGTRRGQWRQLRRSWRTAVGYGIVGVAGCQVCYFNAIERMPVGIALLIEYTGSILVVAWLWLRRGQRPRRLTILGACAAVAGLALMVAIGGSGSADGASASGGISPVGFAWAVTAAVAMAVYFLLSAGPARPARRPEPAGGAQSPGDAPTGDAPTGDGSPGDAPAGDGSAGDAETAGDGELSPVALAWAGMWVGAACLALLLAVHALPAGASARDVVLLRHQVPWVVPVVGIALLSTAVGYSTGISAARRLGAKLASFIGMAEILFAVIYAWVLLGQLPSVTQFLGGALILAGVTLVKADEKADEKAGES